MDLRGCKFGCFTRTGRTGSSSRGLGSLQCRSKLASRDQMSYSCPYTSIDTESDRYGSMFGDGHISLSRSLLPAEQPGLRHSYVSHVPHDQVLEQSFRRAESESCGAQRTKDRLHTHTHTSIATSGSELHSGQLQV